MVLNLKLTANLFICLLKVYIISKTGMLWLLQEVLVFFVKYRLKVCLLYSPVF